MNSRILKYVLGVSVSCAFAISYSNPSKACPVLTDTLTVNSSTQSLITDVRITVVAMVMAAVTAERLPPVSSAGLRPASS